MKPWVASAGAWRRLHRHGVPCHRRRGDARRRHIPEPNPLMSITLRPGATYRALFTVARWLRHARLAPDRPCACMVIGGWSGRGTGGRGRLLHHGRRGIRPGLVRDRDPREAITRRFWRPRRLASSFAARVRNEPIAPRGNLPVIKYTTSHARGVGRLGCRRMGLTPRLRAVSFPPESVRALKPLRHGAFFRTAACDVESVA